MIWRMRPLFHWSSNFDLHGIGLVWFFSADAGISLMACKGFVVILHVGDFRVLGLLSYWVFGYVCF